MFALGTNKLQLKSCTGKESCLQKSVVSKRKSNRLQGTIQSTLMDEKPLRVTDSMTVAEHMLINYFDSK